MKTAAFAAARTARQSATAREVLGYGARANTERVTRLLADPDFAAANTTYNAVEVVNDFVPASDTAHNDAKALRREMYRDPQVRKVTVEFIGSGYVVIAERFSAFTADELASIARSDSEDAYSAFLALYARFLRKIESNAIRYGSLKDVDGPGAAFDHDDAHQEQVLALVELLSSVEEGDDRPFAARFSSRARLVGYEARRFSTPYSIDPFLQTRVQSAVRDAKGDTAAAAEKLATLENSKYRVTRETFSAALTASNPSARMDVADETTKNVDDPSAVSALAAVLTGFDNEHLDTAWNGLTDREKDALTAHLGLDGEAPLSQQEVAQKLGMSRPTVTRTIAGALETLRNAVTPR